MTALERLRDLGYIWPVHGESRDYLQPGIPSLVRFVARCADTELGLEAG